MAPATGAGQGLISGHGRGMIVPCADSDTDAEATGRKDRARSSETRMTVPGRVLPMETVIPALLAHTRAISSRRGRWNSDWANERGNRRIRPCHPERSVSGVEGSTAKYSYLATRTAR